MARAVAVEPRARSPVSRIEPGRDERQPRGSRSIASAGARLPCASREGRASARSKSGGQIADAPLRKVHERVEGGSCAEVRDRETRAARWYSRRSRRTACGHRRAAGGTFRGGGPFRSRFARARPRRSTARRTRHHYGRGNPRSVSWRADGSSPFSSPSTTSRARSTDPAPRHEGADRERGPRRGRRLGRRHAGDPEALGWPRRGPCHPHPENLGKGRAVRTAMSSRAADPRIQDADLEYDPAEYAILCEPIESGRADVVYGSRLPGAPSAASSSSGTPVSATRS